MTTLMLLGVQCSITYSVYDVNNRICIHLVRDGHKLSMLTINVPNAELSPGCVFIKERWGAKPTLRMLSTILKATGRTVSIGGGHKAVEAKLLESI